MVTSRKSSDNHNSYHPTLFTPNDIGRMTRMNRFRVIRSPLLGSIIPSATQTTIVPDRTPLLDVTQIPSKCLFLPLEIKSFNSLASSAQLASCLGCVYDGFIILSAQGLHRIRGILQGKVPEKCDNPGKLDIGRGFISQLGYSGWLESLLLQVENAHVS
ncbi:uncharacterized protein CEXT_624391 [Caerostris extrusa]|uniref:Uncharacterized protein n=1 Tax=Caerostris extrusa TaxID=172846 RepID=A0AAV4TKF5_CAEEX|nr:uncharacterized protein CEXT_624391 [Caerostris extrusa]